MSSHLVKYGDVVVEIESTPGGYRFYDEIKKEWVEVAGDISHCHQRIHQKLHLEHKLPSSNVTQFSPPKLGE